MNGPGEQVRRPARAPKPAPQAAPAHAGTSGTSSSTNAPDPFYGHEDTARMCARFISDLFHCPESAAAAAPAPGGGAVPPTAPPLANFIAYALHRTRLHACVTFTALFLLQRLKLRFPAARGSSGHRLFISAFMIASKVVCDDTYSNKSWCVVGQGMFSLKEINQMEREMCSYLEWKLNFVPNELAEFEVKVRRDYTHSGRPAVPPIVTATAQQQQQQSGRGSLPSPPDSPNTPASSHSMNPSPQSASVVTPPSTDDTTSIASSKTASSMFSSASASTLATSMASSSISGHAAQQQQPGGKTGGEPGYAFATRSVW